MTPKSFVLIIIQKLSISKNGLQNMKEHLYFVDKLALSSGPPEKEKLVLPGFFIIEHGGSSAGTPVMLAPL